MWARENDTLPFLIKKPINSAFFHIAQPFEQSWYATCKRLRNELGSQVHSYPQNRVQTAYE